QPHELELAGIRVPPTALGFAEQPSIDFHHPALVPDDRFILASPDVLRNVSTAELTALAAENPDSRGLGETLTKAASDRGDMDHAVVVVRVTGGANMASSSPT